MKRIIISICFIVSILFANRPLPPDGFAQIYFTDFPEVVKYLKMDIVQDQNKLNYTETMYLIGVRGQNIQIVPNRTKIDCIFANDADLIMHDEYFYSITPDENTCKITICGSMNLDSLRSSLPYFEFKNPIQAKGDYTRLDKKNIIDFKLTLDTDNKPFLVENYTEYPDITYRNNERKVQVWTDPDVILQKNYLEINTK